jgi:hypothetical protein
MDNSQITSLDPPQTLNESPIKKPQAIEILQVLFLVWGGLGEPVPKIVGIV